MKPRCNQSYFINDHCPLFYCERESEHKGHHHAGFDFK